MRKNNTGTDNSGDGNSGNWNSGDKNSGYRNSGDKNSGDRNSGNENSGDWNSGIFNTDEPKMRAFNKECDMTMSEWISSDRYIHFNIPLNVWQNEGGMTSKEKKEIDGWEQTGGYLKTLEYKEAWAEWWKENKSDKMIKKIKRLPNFDTDIFEEITGIKIDESKNLIELSNGAKVSEETIREALEFVAKSKN